MSKNTNSTQFRSVDVDAYDEEQYQDDTTDNTSAAQEVIDRANEVKQLLKQNKIGEALKTALQSPPIGNKESQVQNQNYETVTSVLKAFRGSDIDGAVEALSNEEVDVLMKYIYKGFICNPDKSGTFLNWHEKVFKRGGLGCIVRVMVDRKGV